MRRQHPRHPASVEIEITLTYLKTVNSLAYL